MRRALSSLACLALLVPPVLASAAPACTTLQVFDDRNGDGVQGRSEPGVPGVRIGSGAHVAVTGTSGGATIADDGAHARFVIKPAGYATRSGKDGLQDIWRAPGDCRPVALRRATEHSTLDMLVFADPQPKSLVDVDYYARDIVAPLRRPNAPAADLGISLGDVVNDDLSLYPAVNAVTASLNTPWLHAPGNHDLDADAVDDDTSLRTFRTVYGTDTVAWETPQANVVLLDDVIYTPRATPKYVGGLRDEQLAFLRAYVASAPRNRLLVVGMHIPLFDAAPGVETFRHADRDRLFAILRDVPKVLVLSGHAHTQRHVFHGRSDGWEGATPLHEYNVGAACGAFWSGVKDARGIPDATMSDGTPNGYARLRVERSGAYRLAWYPAAEADANAARTPAMHLHAPRVLRRNAYPAWGVFANVYMGRDDTRVEYRVDSRRWTPMRRVEQPDPDLAAENARDDAAAALRGYDRSPEATPSAHLWRGALPTDLPVGEHTIDVRALDADGAWQLARTTYRLQDAAP